MPQLAMPTFPPAEHGVLQGDSYYVAVTHGNVVYEGFDGGSGNRLQQEGLAVQMIHK